MNELERVENERGARRARMVSLAMSFAVVLIVGMSIGYMLGVNGVGG